MGARLKTFDATGSPPNGVFLAGDINAIMDMKADSNDYTQSINLGTLRVGASDVTLTRFGSEEAQLAAAIRVTKIARLLGGVIPGAFTTAARDALAAAAKPYGLGIINTDKNRFEWNAGTDVAPVWKGMMYGAEAADFPPGLLSGFGTLASRPAAGTVPSGFRYYVTDMDADYQSNGATWTRIDSRCGISAYHIFTTAPAGWRAMNGAAIGAGDTVAADLRAKLIADGSPHGVTGSDPKLPDTRNRVLVGLGTDAEFNALGEIGGVKAVALTAAEMPAHAHGGGDHNHGFPGGQVLLSHQNTGFSSGVWGFVGGDYLLYYHGGTANAGTIISTEGGGGAHSNLQPYMALPNIVHL